MVQSKLCISGITALGQKCISQLWYDEILPIHSQLKTLKSYASCKKMLQWSTVIFSNPSLSLDLNRYDLPFYSPSFLGLWTWKLPSFPDTRINRSHDLITHRSALGRLLRLFLSNLPLLCQAASRGLSGSYGCPPPEGKVNAPATPISSPLHGIISD